MELLVDKIIQHINTDIAYSSQQWGKDFGDTGDIDHHSLITEVMKSDLLSQIKNKLSWAAAVLYLPIDDDQWNEQFSIACNVLVVLFNILSLENAIAKKFRIRQILFNMGMIKIFNAFLEVSNRHGGFFFGAEIIAKISEILLPPLNTIESKSFFYSPNRAYIGFTVTGSLQFIKRYLKETIRLMKKDKFIDPINGEDTTDLKNTGYGIVTFCTYLLTVSKYRKKLFRKDFFNTWIPLLFFQISRLFYQILEKRYGKPRTKEWEDYFNHIIQDKNCEERWCECEKLMETDPISYLYPIWKRCLEFIYILRQYFNIYEIVTYDKANREKTEQTFQQTWYLFTAIVCVQLYQFTGDTHIGYWQSAIENRYVPKNAKPKWLTEIDNEEDFIPNKCFYSKCSKSSEEVKLKKCSHCLCAFYCDKKCQKRDWGNHKIYCKKWELN
eukprot:366438_1